MDDKIDRGNREGALDSRWFHGDGNDPEEKERTRKILLNQTILFDRLRHILNEEFARTVLDSETDFSDPNWALKEAYMRGRRKQLKDLYKILP